MENVEQNKSNAFADQPKADTELNNSDGSAGLPTARVEANKTLAIGELAKASAVLVWLIFLALGGGILLFYYAHIGYLPQIEWSSSIVHLAVAFLIGGVVGLLLALSLLIPGYIWSEFLAFDEGLRKVFYYGPNELCVRTLWWNIGLPFGAVLLICHIALLLFPRSWSQENLLWAYAGVSAVLLALVTIIMRVHFNCILHEKSGPVWRCTFRQLVPKHADAIDQKRSVFKYTLWFALSILLSQVSMILIYLLSGPQSTIRQFLVTTGFCSVGVLISNHVVAVHYRRNRLHAVAASLVVASLLLFVADRNSSLSSQIMKRYGLGPDSTPVDLLVSDEGVRIIEQLNLQQDNCTQPSHGGRICGVKILSRLGEEYYLQIARNDETFRFTLPKEIVMSRIPQQ